MGQATDQTDLPPVAAVYPGDVEAVVPGIPRSDTVLANIKYDDKHTTLMVAATSGREREHVCLN